MVEFDVDARQEEMASWLMIQQGANGCQHISQNKGLVTLQASFNEDRLSPDRLDPLYAALDEFGLAAVGATLRINKLEEEDWLAEWKKGLQPIKLGENFLVSPPWFEGKIPAEDLKGRRVIWIEPGLAFGTGFHFTTQFCLRAIERHLSARVLDVGTGSGILAIAVFLLKPEARIVAVETDPLACRIARETLELNESEKQIELIEGSTEKVAGESFDLILSNLTCEDNLALLPEYEQFLPVGGKVIMSGILVEKLPVLETSLLEHGFELLEKETNETWAGIVVRKQAAG